MLFARLLLLIHALAFALTSSASVFETQPGLYQGKSTIDDRLGGKREKSSEEISICIAEPSFDPEVKFESLFEGCEVSQVDRKRQFLIYKASCIQGGETYDAEIKFWPGGNDSTSRLSLSKLLRQDGQRTPIYSRQARVTHIADSCEQ